MSFESIHNANQRANPTQIITYKHALLLNKIYDDETTNMNWVDLFFSQHFNQRNQRIKLFNTSTYKLGNNLFTNRFTIVNGKIDPAWLNYSFDTYKIKYKTKFLSIP